MQTHKHAQILVVEDDFVISREIKQRLENLAYRVTAVVASGEADVMGAKALCFSWFVSTYFA